MVRRIAALFCAVAFAAAAAGQSFNYKPELESGKRKYVAPSANGAEIVRDNCLKTPGALLLSTGKLKSGNFVGANFNVPTEKLKDFKGKPIVFRFQAKHLNGSGELAYRMRAWNTKEGKWDLVFASPPVKLQGKTGEWAPLEVKCRIPDIPEITGVDFHGGVYLTPDLTEYLIDEPSLEVLPDTAAGSFASPLLCYATTEDTGRLELVRDGKPLAAIVTAAKPTPCVQYAVKELNDHFQLCLGTTLPVIADGDSFAGPEIHVGKTTLTERFGVAPAYLAPDHWVVRRVGKDLIISGGDNKDGIAPGAALVPFGTLFASYEFLERFLGVRWYWPGKLGTVAPAAKGLALGAVNLNGSPSYEARFAFYDRHVDPEISAAESLAWWLRMRRGGLGGSPIGMHSFNSWPDRFGKTHPEYFAIQTDGKPLIQCGPGGAGGHVCMSNPDVLRQTVVDKVEEFKKRPWQKLSPVMPGDSDDLFHCRCPNCQAKVGIDKPASGKHSDAVWGFVNQVATELYKTNPDRLITCCSYGNYADVPDFPLMPNVAVTLCCGTPNDFFSPDGKKRYSDIIGAWQKTGASLYVWDYWDGPRRQKGSYGAPTLFPRAIKEYLLMDYGKVKGHVLELCEIDASGATINNWTSWLYDSLNVYVAMRLLWDMDADPDALVNEFYAQFYGPGAPWVEKFYTEMEAAYENPDTKNGPEFKWYWETIWLKTYPPQFVNRVMGYLREAVKATEGQEPFHARALKTLEGFAPFQKNSLRFSGVKTDERKTLSVPEAAAPTIDGKDDDACWKGAAETSKFTDSFLMYDLKGGTTARLCRDADNLYVLFSARFPAGAELKMDLEANSHDRFVWDEESCELFLVQGGRKYQFLISPNNALLDIFQPDISQKFNLEEGLKWNCAGLRSATSVNGDQWTAELSIPLKSLELKSPTLAAPWEVNFNRNYFYRGPDGKTWQNELSCWSPTFGSFHDVSRFGKLFFRDYPPRPK